MFVHNFSWFSSLIIGAAADLGAGVDFAAGGVTGLAGSAGGVTGLTGTIGGNDEADAEEAAAAVAAGTAAVMALARKAALSSDHPWHGSSTTPKKLLLSPKLTNE